MGRQRSFDYDECRALYASGKHTQVELAQRYGVTTMTIRYALYEKVRRYQIEKQLEGRLPCRDCGAPVFRKYDGRVPRCRSCFIKSRATGVRADDLHCYKCETWKPDRQFPLNRGGVKLRRGRHSVCRECQTVIKREWRVRHALSCSVCGSAIAPDNRGSGMCATCYSDASRKQAA